MLVAGATAAQPPWRLLAVPRRVGNVLCAHRRALVLGNPSPAGKAHPQVRPLPRSHRAIYWPLTCPRNRRVYRWFVGVYRLCYFLACLGFVVVLMQLFNVRAVLFLPEVLVDVAVISLFFGLYFGVLTRDCAEMCTGRIAATLEVSGGAAGAQAAMR